MFIDRFRTDLSLEEVIELSRDIAKNIQKEFLPEIIISIDNRGILPGFEIANQFENPYLIMSIKRNIDLENIYNRTPEFLIPLIKIYQGYLFLKSTPQLKRGIDVDIFDKDILLVDDTIHTGKTLEIAKKYLQNLNPKSMKIASINYIGNEIPDFSAIKGRCKFPWSKNSTDHIPFKNYIQEHGFDLC